MYSQFFNNEASANIRSLLSKEVCEVLLKIGCFADKKSLRVFAVGGFVRDLILNKANFDIDIVVEGDAKSFVTELASEFNAEFKIFDRFHTAKIYSEKINFDFSSSRKETYKCPGALPEVTFSNIYDDLFRRDFTINAMALSLNSDNLFKIVDYFGGIKDLEASVIRVMHKKSFEDDPTRLYRALRFAHRFGFKLEEETNYLFKQAIKDKRVSSLSVKRIASEISKIFKEDMPETIIEELTKNKMLKHFAHNVRIPPLEPLGVEDILSADLEAIYWIYFLSQMPPTFKSETIDQLGLPHSSRVKVLDGLDAFKKIPAALEELTCQDHIKLYYLLKKHCIEGLLALSYFKLNKTNSEKIIYYLKNLRLIAPVINGKDLIDCNIPAGQHIKNILNYITELRLENKSLSKLEELEIAKQLYANIQHKNPS